MADTIALSQHARQRCAQRGVTPDILALIRQIATNVPDGLFVRKKDAQRRARDLRHQAEQIERLGGKTLVFSESWVITTYHATSTKARKLLRRTPDRDQDN